MSRISRLRFSTSARSPATSEGETGLLAKFKSLEEGAEGGSRLDAAPLDVVYDELAVWLLGAGYCAPVASRILLGRADSTVVEERGSDSITTGTGFRSTGSSRA